MLVSIPSYTIRNGGMTHAVLDRDPNEAVIVVCYKSCQIGYSASLPVTAAMDPNEDGQARIRVGRSRCVDLDGFSNIHST